MRKKILSNILALSLLSSLSFAATLDINQAKTKWTAYKTSEKVAVSGTFNDIKYKFGKKQNSIAEILEGATATINPLSVNLNDEVKNTNVRESFFAKFAKSDMIKVTFRNVIEGKDQGSILASVNMNGKTVKVPMQYSIKDGVLEAKGILDILEFGAKEAFKSLATTCHDLHSGLTWSQVEISFSAPVK
ncbi:YceI family protein [Helicobacter anatolicus]|uniref:YceI family protein n=1 Tax=Helicobacter anatolicus TaxID=2905874 RepID=UPI001E5FE34D|nr:YceI family protein [Helicobacter anatolicus]MCE3039755.1 YceI family protein [Helicobacter anatolicus]